jgi:DNA-binding response OmpR family regulator
VAYVLIIDDEPPIRELLREVFSGAGFEVGLAETGTRGLNSVAARAPDLVVTDILMPEKEGLETILELRRTSPGIPIIAMSGGSPRMPFDVLETARRFGAARVFPKPFDPFELVAAARELLGQQADRAAS